MVLDWGMSEKIGLVNYTNDDRRILPMELPGKQYSEHTAELVDGEVKRIMDEAYAATRSILETHREKLDGIAQALLKYETLSAEEVQQILDGKSLDKPTVGDLIAAEQAKSGEPKPEPGAKTIARPAAPDSPLPPVPEPG
jgi:cell division protease FtsH